MIRLFAIMTVLTSSFPSLAFATGSIRFFWGTDSSGNLNIMSTDSVLTLCWILCEYGCMMMVLAAVLRALKYSAR